MRLELDEGRRRFADGPVARHYLEAEVRFGPATIVDVERWVGWSAGR